MTKMKEKYQAINWNKIQNRVDYSAWSRLNDFIWEPERIPVKEDVEEFNKLSQLEQDTILKAFAALGFLSTIQVKVGNDSVKQDAVTQQEFSVFNAFAYHESISNKAYSNVIGTLSAPGKVNDYFDWANNNEELQEIADLYLALYQHGESWQKKIALSFMEMSIYHACFYAPLYIFGTDRLTRTAEVVKLAIRTTTFNAMYPGVKLRLNTADYSEQAQAGIENWIKDFQTKLDPIMNKFILDLYSQINWQDDAMHYWHYTMNKNYMNLGYQSPYDEDADSISDQIQKGVIKSADFEDFFYYSNDNALTKYNPKNE